jgi:hypothetical protein
LGVVKTSEIKRGKMKSEEVKGVDVLIANVNGKFHAIDDRCGHMNAALWHVRLESSASLEIESLCKNCRRLLERPLWSEKKQFLNDFVNCLIACPAGSNKNAIRDALRKLEFLMVANYFYAIVC